MTAQAQTLVQLVAKYNALATASNLPTRKSFENKTAAQDAIKALEATAKKTKTKTGAALRVRKAAEPHLAGPRGFKFGPKWYRSILVGAGIALSPRNFPKLRHTGESLGVAGAADATDQAVLASAIAELVQM